MNEQKTVLIAGATGVAAQSIVEIVSRTPGWQALGLSRRPPAIASADMRHVAADMLDAESCRQAMHGIEVTHLVYCARAKHQLYTSMLPGKKVGIENVEPNLDMLRNLVAACDGPALRHVHVVQGSKWYGFHLGPYPTPARESSPGHMPPNFYFDQHRFLTEAAAGKAWKWSTSRPAAINGRNVGSGPNLVSTIGAYAAISRHLGLPLDFPGKPAAYTGLMELTEAEQLAESIMWMFDSPAANNQSFNVVNGDYFRWQQLWPRIADLFDMKPGTVRNFPLVQWMADKAPLWDEIIRINGLQQRPLEDVASWGFADFLLHVECDVMSSTTKIQQAGFHRVVDTEEMILDQLSHYRAEKILP